jgi:Lrp/AsnC family transcriptional regulator, leucine-responsive regulatory protein
MTLDRIDFHILRILQENAWTSVKQISATVGLSLSTTSQRIKILKENGHLLSTHAVVNRRSMNIGLEALFLIQLDKHDKSIVEDFMASIIKLPEILSVYLITGANDIIANAVVRDTDHLKSLAFEQFTNRPFISKIETAIVYNSLHSRVMTPL